MSAGTILVMSGDSIYMDYFSILGPVDPQVERPGGQLMPALGYLIQYERLVEKSRKGKLTTAELNYLIERFDPVELYAYEQARELSKTLLNEWLVKYKFKNWTKTETHHKRVTGAMKKRRASEIASKLNETEYWHSHGRGISMEVLRRDLNLKIDDFGADSNLSEMVRSYHKLLTDYMMRRAHRAIIHVDTKYVAIF